MKKWKLDFRVWNEKQRAHVTFFQKTGTECSAPSTENFNEEYIIHAVHVYPLLSEIVVMADKKPGVK